MNRRTALGACEELRRVRFHCHYEDTEAARVYLARCLGQLGHYRLAWRALECAIPIGVDDGTWPFRKKRMEDV